MKVNSTMSYSIDHARMLQRTMPACAGPKVSGLPVGPCQPEVKRIKAQSASEGQPGHMARVSDPAEMGDRKVSQATALACGSG